MKTHYLIFKINAKYIVKIQNISLKMQKLILKRQNLFLQIQNLILK